MMDKKNPYRFTIKFNPNISGQKAASDLLNSRPDKASYLANAILQYEQAANTDSATESSALADIYAELREIKQMLLSALLQSAPKLVTSINIASTEEATPSEMDIKGKELLRNMLGSFPK